MRRHAMVLWVGALAAGCGSSSTNATGPGSSNPQDVAVAPDGSLWVPLYNVPSLLVVPPNAPVAGEACPGTDDVLAAVSDYQSSAVGGLAFDGGVSLRSGVDLGQDPALTLSRGRAFFLARDNGYLFELDPSCGTPIRETNANITGAAQTTVDLSTYDTDGNPQASAIRIVDGLGSPPASKAFVALERLDDANMLLPYPGRPGMMLRIDVATAKVEAQIVLQGQNPFGQMVEFGGGLFLVDAGGRYDVNNPLAGVERFDETTSTSRMLVTAEALGGWPAEVAIATGCGVAIVADSTGANATSLVTFDPDTGAVFASAANPIFHTSGYFLSALAWVGDELLVGEGDPAEPRASVVHVFRRMGTAGCALTEEGPPLPVPLKAIALRAVP